MTKNINIELTDEEFKKLKKYKERNYLTWKGVLMEGTPEARKLEEAEEG